MTVNIEVLVVPDCPNDAKAINSARTALAHEHLAAHITRTVIATDQQARERNCTGSPTILINGTDPFARPGQPIGLTCRLYPTVDGLQGVPPLPDLRHALRNSPHEPGMPTRHTPDSPRGTGRWNASAATLQSAISTGPIAHIRFEAEHRPNRDDDEDDWINLSSEVTPEGGVPHGMMHDCDGVLIDDGEETIAVACARFVQDQVARAGIVWSRGRTGGLLGASVVDGAALWGPRSKRV